MSTVVDLYTIQIINDGPVVGYLDAREVARMMAETEENMSDLLPPDYRAQIRRWNTPNPDERTNPDA